MRNLTIQRAKSFVASLGTLKVYIEDPEAGELNINGCLCRKLGVIKNGETVTFQISDAAARVYIIADKLSRGYCNEFYPLPASSEDIILSGKCYYNLAAGHPFRFDDVTDEQVLKNRKKGTRKGIIVLAVAVVVGLVLAFLVNMPNFLMNMPKEKTFSVSGLEITLTSEFEEEDFSGYDAAYCTNEVMVVILKERISMYPELKNYMLEEYGQVVIEENEHKGTLSQENGVTYYEYQAKADNGETYHYIVTMHKSDDAFWLVQFFTLEADIDEYRDDIFQWAASVTFED